MKYEKPNMFIILIEDSYIITTSPTPGILDIPGTDIDDENAGINGDD